ncbi:MAG: hypothetical protein JF626_04910 [Polaromonas sp.]|nr:hypothetical protein [Polaromonas sp.]
MGIPAKGQIDCVHILNDQALAGLGNKAKIGAIRDHINQLSANTSETVSQKFGSLVDREWDGIDFAIPLQKPWEPPTQQSGSFITLGHSIENYFFHVAGVEAYLRMFFADKLSGAFFQALEQRFHHFIALAISYSFEMQRIAAITRSDGVINHMHVEWANEKYHVLEPLKHDLLQRGIAVPQSYLDDVNANIDLYLQSHHQAEPGRWICHGHLGQQAIWSCIANLVREHGVDPATVTAIERGTHNNKFKHSADCLCREAIDTRIPLDEALTWLSA